MEAIAAVLVEAAILTPGYIPPPAGLLHLDAMAYAKDRDGYETVVLPDRNLVSRMARAARDGRADLSETTMRHAVFLMAYCQALAIDLEPSIAFHELGACADNVIARAELSWFRAADRGSARQWIDLATGRSTHLVCGDAAALSAHDFSRPLRRWRRNYVVALKAAELELRRGMRPIDRALDLIDWMDQDFLLAGPAALFASMYFGPLAARAGLFKRLRSERRQEALHGLRNAAWDMTHLSEFVRRVTASQGERRRYIFASGDLSLVQLASGLFLGPDPVDGVPSLEEKLRDWWPASEARRLADTVFLKFDIGRFANRDRPNPSPAQVQDLISQGENALIGWRPN